jgi:hypothetical protein
VTETSFDVRYDGPALATGRMPVRELAPALLALGDLFAEASAEVYPERVPVGLDIKATDEGSFIVLLILRATWDEIKDLFSSDAAAALVNLKELVIGADAAGLSLFGFLKWLRGRRVTQQVAIADGMVRVTLDDGDAVEVRSHVLAMHGNVRVRRQLRQVVEPLRRDGIDVLEFREDKEVTVSIGATEVDVFALPDDEPVPVGDSEQTLVLMIASVAFTEGNKWRFSDGVTTFHATIDDEAFLTRVDDGTEAFRKGDMLRCRVRTIQSVGAEGLRADRHVLQVLEHIPREQQLRFGAPDV